MPYLNRDGVKIYYEERGSGPQCCYRTATAPARGWRGSWMRSIAITSSHSTCAATIV